MKKILLFYIFMGMTVLAFAHGIHVEIHQQSPFIVVSSAYSGGTAVVGALVKIERTGADANDFQSGRTDVQGYFIFKPDRAGEWMVIIDDERGHRKEVAISLDEDFFDPVPPEQQEVPEPEIVEKKIPFVPLYIKILLGLGLIFGLTGFFYGLKANQKRKLD